MSHICITHIQKYKILNSHNICIINFRPLLSIYQNSNPTQNVCFSIITIFCIMNQLHICSISYLQLHLLIPLLLVFKIQSPLENLFNLILLFIYSNLIKSSLYCSRYEPTLKDRQTSRIDKLKGERSQSHLTHKIKKMKQLRKEKK